jgi:hypothetical protein
MKVYCNRWFNKWLKKSKLSTLDLLNAVSNLENQISSVNLGANLYKVRIPLKNSGKSGGYRTFVVYNQGVRSIFVSAFAKNERANISKAELDDLKELSKVLTSIDINDFQALIFAGSLIQIVEKNNE